MRIVLHHPVTHNGIDYDRGIHDVPEALGNQWLKELPPETIGRYTEPVIGSRRPAADSPELRAGSERPAAGPQPPLTANQQQAPAGPQPQQQAPNRTASVGKDKGEKNESKKE